ncbi:hypothetical protein PV327_001598 [Microctonus hyperodae]|uniref:Uncharacterized protein n=1 Tax=Microctonus hyperodae TaxID=165561 RepID=A0AA39KNF6_MICHY|nr:hypothetical protein PV327_001598 [Microctonus hyperodae]
MGLLCYLCRRKASKGDRISLHKGNEFRTRCTLRSNAVPSIGVPNTISYSNDGNTNIMNIDVSNKNTPNIEMKKIVKNDTLDMVCSIENVSESNNVAVNVNTYGNVIVHANSIENVINNAHDVIVNVGTFHDVLETENGQELSLPIHASNEENKSPELCNDITKRRSLVIKNATADSEIDHNFVQSEESCYATPKRRVFEPRYISEIRTPDFETPRRTKRILSFVRDTDKKKSKMIKALREKNRKLEKRICSLTEVIEHLKKNMVTDGTGDALLV